MVWPAAACAQVAIKFLERGAGVNKSVLREILNHRLCVVHPNIVQFREVSRGSSQGTTAACFTARGS